MNEGHEMVVHKLENQIRTLENEKQSLLDQIFTLEEQARQDAQIIQDVRNERDADRSQWEAETISWRREVEAANLKAAEYRTSAEGVQSVLDSMGAAVKGGQNNLKTKADDMAVQTSSAMARGPPANYKSATPDNRGPAPGFQARRNLEEKATREGKRPPLPLSKQQLNAHDVGYHHTAKSHEMPADEHKAEEHAEKTIHDVEDNLGHFDNPDDEAAAIALRKALHDDDENQTELSPNASQAEKRRLKKQKEAEERIAVAQKKASTAGALHLKKAQQEKDVEEAEDALTATIRNKKVGKQNNRPFGKGMAMSEDDMKKVQEDARKAAARVAKNRNVPGGN